MTKDEPAQGPPSTPSRDAARAEALRANLLRRKAQARARAAQDDPEAPRPRGGA